nr:hypothetical protein [Tanacetum cinerariifolium]
DESGVTYTDISSPFEELSDIRSPRADDHKHFELPEMLDDPYVERTMPMRTLRRILLIFLPMEEMTAMTRKGSSEDDEDDDMDIEADEEEEEHLAPA